MSIQERKNHEQQEYQIQEHLLLQETPWEKRQREAAEAEEAYWDAVELGEFLDAESDW